MADMRTKALSLGASFSIFKNKEDKTMKSIWISLQVAFSALAASWAGTWAEWMAFSTR